MLQQDFTSVSVMCQSLRYEVCTLLKVYAEIKMVRVIGWYPMVDHVCTHIIFGTCLHVHVRVSFCGVEDVGHSQLSQEFHVCGHRPEIQCTREVTLLCHVTGYK